MEEDLIMKKDRYIMGEDITDLEIIEPEPEPITIPIPKVSQEEITLNRVREDVKDKYPQLLFEESREFIETIRSNPKCSICRSFTKQSKISDIKAKIRRDKEFVNKDFMLKIYKNTAEKHEDSKGYCCIGVSGNDGVSNKHTKTMIPVPEKSLCSDYNLDLTIKKLCVLVMNGINEKEKEEKLKLEKKILALKQKEEAIKLINSIDEKYNNKKEEIIE